MFFQLKHGIFQKNKIISPNSEIDIALTKFKKLKVVGEVKWKSKITRKEIRKIEEKLLKFRCKKILIIPKKENLEIKPEKEIETITAEDLIKLAQKQ